jgi:RNA polymerase sigma-70 factor (ECF subfamily)
MMTEGEAAVRIRRNPMAESISDDEGQRLAQAALNGDTAAFDALVDRYWRKVASVAGRLLPNANEVEDITQETFLRAFQGLRGYRGEASVQAWLLRIAINLCKNRRSSFWQRRVRLAHGESSLQTESPDDACALAETALLNGEWERTVHCALGQLPEKYRLPILLHFFEGLSGAEIAAILQWNESTVWSRIYAGCKQLRNKLGSWFET